MKMQKESSESELVGPCEYGLSDCDAIEYMQSSATLRSLIAVEITSSKGRKYRAAGKEAHCEFFGL